MYTVACQGHTECVWQQASVSHSIIDCSGHEVGMSYNLLSNLNPSNALQDCHARPRGCLQPAMQSASLLPARNNFASEAAPYRQQPATGGLVPPEALVARVRCVLCLTSESALYRAISSCPRHHCHMATRETAK